MDIKKRMVLGVALTMLLGALPLSGCSAGTTAGGDTSELEGTIDIQGSDTLLNVATAWSEIFMDENPGVDISVQGGGSGTGIAALLNGTVDFAIASRDMKDEERTEAEAQGIDPVEHKVALDAIAVIVNPDNGVDELTMAQLGEIFRGEKANWKDFGGKDLQIVLVSRDSSSGTYDYFREEVVAAEDEDAEFAQSAKLLPSNQAISDEVKANQGAIGYVGLGYVTDAVKVVTVDGVKASVETATENSYPISRYLYIYSNGEPQGVMATYLEWILGEEGQQLVADEGFVPLP
ncbi:MAG: PstS family phosphate ABC transporter substrate-binding protein [Coriobacteriia bacterium]|nr:PstS family phosphate ABC transporter substrate-binding protein [Coriobacteriia bacterium]